MIKTFKDERAERIFNLKPLDPKNKIKPFEKIALRKLRMIDAAHDYRDLRVPPNNHLEQLQGDRKGSYSIHINDQYVICFQWIDGDAYDVEITDYH